MLLSCHLRFGSMAHISEGVCSEVSRDVLESYLSQLDPRLLEFQESFGVSGKLQPCPSGACSLYECDEPACSMCEVCGRLLCQEHTRGRPWRSQRCPDHVGRPCVPMSAVYLDDRDSAVYCPDCQMWLNGPTQWQRHKTGFKHRKHVTRAQAVGSGV